MDDDIPPLRRPEDMPPIRTQADLYRHWRALMGELGFGYRSLWVQLIGPDDRSAPMLLHIEHLEEEPDELFLTNLMGILRHVTTDSPADVRVAMLLSRPGRRDLTTSDRIWIAGLQRSAAQAALFTEPMHLANDQELRVVTPDDFDLPDSAA
jgi:hypothetical protein